MRLGVLLNTKLCEKVSEYLYNIKERVGGVEKCEKRKIRTLSIKTIYISTYLC